MLRLLRELWGEQAGITTVEYAMVMALVATAAIVSYYYLGRDVRHAAASTSRRLGGAMVSPASPY